MKKLLLVLALTSLVFCLFSCKDTETGEEGKFLDDVDIELLEEDTLNLSLTVPDGWNKTHSSYMGSEIRHYAAPQDDSRDDYLENVSITCETLDKEMTLDEYARANLESLEMFYADFKLISDKENLKVNGLDALKIVYSYSMGTFSLKTCQVFLLDGLKAYNVLCIAEEENYENYEDIFTKAYESFKID